MATSTERAKAVCAKLEQELDPAAEISCANWSAAVSEARAGTVVVLDEGDDAAEAAARLAERGVSSVLLADNPEAGWVAQLLATGVRSVLRRDCSGRQLASAVQAVAAGLSALEPEFLQFLLRPPLESIELEPGEEELTPRETEVLHMMTAGLSNREIANTLGISEHTVKFHITSIFGKLGTSSRTEAVTEGIRRGLILL